MQRLAKHLAAIEGKGYKAYKALQGRYHFVGFDLQIDHVQGDPFANPSRCRVFIDECHSHLEPSYYSSPCRRVALEDFLGRSFTQAIANYVKGGRGSGMSGEMLITDYGQQVLERNAVLVKAGTIELRLQIGLPADKRTINAQQAEAMLLSELPKVIEQGIAPLTRSPSQVEDHINSVDNQRYLRQQLAQHQLVSFIADGSLLARRSGIDDRPLLDSVPCHSPESLAVELECRDGQTVRGLGIREGITLVVGGGFHGKSTVLHALERGVYDHIPGDGREQVVTVDSAVKIRAEDRRAITDVDISAFINDLPQGKSTVHFTTQDASGSTSQAANIMEALATGTTLLLIDEDTSANNFMIRDQRMKRLVSKDKEPITPLIERIDDLKSGNHISLVLIMGGSGDFFSYADTVVMLDNYQFRDVSFEAKQLAEIRPTKQPTSLIENHVKRFLSRESVRPYNAVNKEKIQALDTRILRYGQNDIDVSQVEQLVSRSQLDAIGYLLRYFYHHYDEFNVSDTDISEVLAELIRLIEQEGLDFVCPYVMGTLAVPRHYEFCACVNRIRILLFDLDQELRE